MPKCKCGQSIEWVRTTGAAMPVNTEPRVRIRPHPRAGRTVVVTDGGAVRRGDAVPTTDAGEDVVEGRLSHFATCPEADSFRRRS